MSRRVREQEGAYPESRPQGVRSVTRRHDGANNSPSGDGPGATDQCRPECAGRIDAVVGTLCLSAQPDPGAARRVRPVVAARRLGRLSGRLHERPSRRRATTSQAAAPNRIPASERRASSASTEASVQRVRVTGSTPSSIRLPGPAGPTPAPNVQHGLGSGTTYSLDELCREWAKHLVVALLVGERVAGGVAVPVGDLISVRGRLARGACLSIRPRCQRRLLDRLRLGVVSALKYP